MKILYFAKRGELLTGSGTYRDTVISAMSRHHEIKLFESPQDLREYWDIIHFLDIKHIKPYLLKRIQAPYIVDVPDYYFLNFYPFFCVDLPARFILQKYRKWKYQTILNKTPGLIFHCEFVKSQIEHPNKNIVHIGIEASRFERNPRPPRTNTILFVGSDYFRKGLPTVFKVFRSILKEHPEFELKIVGKERRHALIAAKIMSRKLPVSYYSGLSHEELVNLYLSAKVFVLPSRLEASSVALLEAMAAGIPIVSTYVGGIPEFIVHGQNGFLAASADDYKSLVKYINICLDDGAVVRRLVRNGKRVVAQFTIPRMVEQLEQSYQSVLNT